VQVYLDLDSDLYLYILLFLLLTEKAFGDDGCLKQAKELSINKVGHGQYAK
jgi:hypothetical protein